MNKNHGHQRNRSACITSRKESFTHENSKINLRALNELSRQMKEMREKLGVLPQNMIPISSLITVTPTAGGGSYISL